MEYRKIFKRRIISTDGRSIAEAKSIAYAFGDSESIITQNITLNISSNGYSSSRSSSSSVSITK
ncbi:MAG: hypothetical protein F6K41_36595 [Symploca sp. SIO3E6]|nr:hypothetical protein [Caldora sp. SIO3E6]